MANNHWRQSNEGPFALLYTWHTCLSITHFLQWCSKHMIFIHVFLFYKLTFSQSTNCLFLRSDAFVLPVNEWSKNLELYDWPMRVVHVILCAACMIHVRLWCRHHNMYLTLSLSTHSIATQTDKYIFSSNSVEANIISCIHIQVRMYIGVVHNHMGKTKVRKYSSHARILWHLVGNHFINFSSIG